jgi:hypothetical protein
LWTQQFKSEFKLNPFLSLLPSPVIETISKLLYNKSIGQLSLLLPLIFGRSRVQWQCIRKALKSVPLKKFKSPKNWLSKVRSRFEYLWKENLPLFRDSSQVSLMPSTRLYFCGQCHRDVLKVLCHIYPKNAPQPYELFWCESRTSSSSMNELLARAASHIDLVFVLIQVDQLSPVLQLIVKAILENDKFDLY